jgi:hypothetical protein
MVDALLFELVVTPVTAAVDAVIFVVPGHVVAVPFNPLRQAAEFKSDEFGLAVTDVVAIIVKVLSDIVVPPVVPPAVPPVIVALLVPLPVNQSKA